MAKYPEHLDRFALPISYFCIVGALYSGNGNYNALSLILLGIAIIVSYYYYFRIYITRRALKAGPAPWTKTGWLTAIVAIVFIMSITRYFFPKIPSLSCKIIFILLIAAEAALIVRPKKGSLYLFCGLVFSHNLIYSLSLGPPPIDVYHFIDEGARCILNGQNPYTHLYPQVYPAEKIKEFYGALSGAADGIAFQPYMPLALLLSALGALLGDIRIVTIAAFALTPIVFYLILRESCPAMDDRKKRLLAMAPLCFPIQGHFLFQAWNDVLPGLFFTLFILFTLRKTPLLAYASLAVMIGLKQYTAFFVLPMLFLVNLRDYKLYLAMFLFLAVPLALFGFADAHGLVKGLVVFHLNQPFRPDSLSLAAFLYTIFNIRIFNPAPYFGILLSTNLAFLFLKKDKTSDYAGAVFSSYILFSLFLILSKQSFANYYYLLSVILYCFLVMRLKPGIAMPTATENLAEFGWQTGRLPRLHADIM
jgi:hypothetical protein